MPPRTAPALLSRGLRSRKVFLLTLSCLFFFLLDFADFLVPMLRLRMFYFSR